jgi:lysyl-tRNA synthetase class 2
MVSIELQGGFFDDPEQRAGLVLLLAMLLSFGFIRFSVRMIRAEVSWWPGNIQTDSGLHIHHLVFGIVLMMVAGFSSYATDPESPWLEILAAGFGVGMGLTLDEFALWLHLEDVYWADEGRQSVDAIIFAAIIGGAALMGTVPLGADDSSWPVFVITVGGNLACCAIAAVKGKYIAAVAGMLVPPVAWVAAVRLARPGSWWANRRYAAGSEKLAKATAREERHQARRRWIQDHIGGMASERG